MSDESRNDAVHQAALVVADHVARATAGLTPPEREVFVIDERLAGPVPAAPLHLRSGRRIGCIAAGHETDQTLAPDVLLENLAAKMTAAMALRGLLAGEAIDPGSVDYVIGSGEEAVGDRYERVLFLAKGSLFLGRMTLLADGISVIVERNE